MGVERGGGGGGVREHLIQPSIFSFSDGLAADVESVHCVRHKKGRYEGEQQRHDLRAYKSSEKVSALSYLLSQVTLWSTSSLFFFARSRRGLIVAEDR